MAWIFHHARGRARTHARAATPHGGLGLRHSRPAWILLALTVALGVYALIGFELVPLLIRHEAIAFVRDEYGRTLQVGETRFHPFKLYAELRDVSLPDRDGERLLRVDRLFVDFQALSSIWQRSFVFREITLDRPRARAVVRPDGGLNFADLAAKAPARGEKGEKKQQKRGPPPLWIRSLAVNDGRLDFLDYARPHPFTESLAPLSFALKDFRSSTKGGAFRCDASDGGSMHLTLQGRVAVAPSTRSSGALHVRGLPATKLAEYLGEALPFAVPRGHVAIDLSYRTAAAEPLQTLLHLERLVLTDLELAARGAERAWVRLPQVAVEDGTVDLGRRHVELAALSVTGARVDVRLEADGTLNLTRLLRRAPDKPQPAAVERVEAAVRRQRHGWSARVSALQLSGADFELEDRKIAPGTRLRITPVLVRAEGLSLDTSRAVPVRLEAQIAEDAGSLRAQGTVRPAPFSGDLELAAEGISLALAQPYVAQHAALRIRGGSVSAHGRIALRSADAQEPQARFTGRVSVDGLKTVDDELGQDFVNFKRLALDGVTLEHAPDALHVARVKLTQPYARVVLSAKQTLNVSEVLAPQRSENARRQESGAAARPQPSGGPEPGRPAAEQTPAITIGAVLVEGMRLHFSDYYVQPNFSAELWELRGALKGLSSDPKSRARVYLSGNLGENSPVKIAGKLQPFAYDKFSDLTIRCENISLPVFNPYSGRFAGYNIDRGELSTEMHYLLQNRKLSAQHHVRIDQLTWGDKTETKAKAPLPVKLATVVLRDRHGVISLDLPVKGSLDDPKFRVGPLVWQAVKNVIVKAATAPFELLGSLFHGAEKARFVEFAPGRSELDAGAKQGLSALGGALREHPNLTLDVPVGTAGELDMQALGDQKFRAALQESATASAHKHGQRAAPVAYDALDDEHKLAALKRVYEHLAGEKPKLGRAPAAPKGTPRRSAKERERAYQLEQLTAATRAKVRVEPSELEALGRARGEAVENELVRAGKLDASRVLLSKRGKVSTDKGKARYELELR
jgi:hypothetical protein